MFCTPTPTAALAERLAAWVRDHGTGTLSPRQGDGGAHGGDDIEYGGGNTRKGRPTGGESEQLCEIEVD